MRSFGIRDLIRTAIAVTVFIEELFKGTFGEMLFTKEELENEGIDFMDKPFFTFVRRVVEYKKLHKIIDALYNEKYRKRIIASKAVFFVGGRRFGTYYDDQRGLL